MASQIDPTNDYASFAVGNGGSGSLTCHHYAGPFVDPTTEDLFIILSQNQGSGSRQQLNCWRSQNGGATWTEMDAANNPAHGGLSVYGVGVAQYARVLYIASHTADRVYFHRFDMAQGTSGWSAGSGTVDNQIAGTWTEETGGEGQIHIVAVSDQNLWILYSGEQTPTTAYERIDYGYSTNGGSNWTVDQVYCDEASYDNTCASYGYNPNVGILYGAWSRDDTDNAYIREQTTVNGSPDTPTLLTDYTLHTENAVQANGPMPNYMDGAVETVCYVRLEDTTNYARSVFIHDGTPDSSASIQNITPYVGGGYDASTHHRVAMATALDEANKRVYFVYADSSTRDLWYTTNTDEGGWATPTEILDATNVEAVSANIYERADWVRLGIVYQVSPDTNPNGDAYFHEVALYETTPWEPETNADETIRTVTSGRTW